MLLNRCRLVGALSGGVESECGAVDRKWENFSSL